LTPRVWIIPAVIAALAVSGVLAARAISIPTLAFTYDENFRGESARAIFTVNGVRCYGTADYLREHIASVPGLISMVAYGGKQRIVVDYAVGQTTPEAIVGAIEAPVMTKTGPRSFYKVLSWKAQ
jgi:hypothetical protein